MKKSVIVALLVMACLLSGSGCSTTTRVTIDSSPSGADVILDGVNIGTTPIEKHKISNRVGRSYDIILKKDGYQLLQARLKTEIKTASLIGAILITIPVVWVEGPKEAQYFVLKKESDQ